jgi:hypothetical protein
MILKLPSLIGIPELKQEESESGSIGLQQNSSCKITITADAYSVYIKDRVVTDQFAKPTGTQTTGTITKHDAAGATAASVLCNSINTRSKV